VNHAGVFDNRSGYYTTDELSVVEGDLAGAEFDNPAAYSKQNPIDYVKNWRTPMLIIHGQLDSRVAYSQGLAAFTALQRVGWPGELLIFPDEGHWISKPANIAQWYDSVIGWLKTYTRQ
jgi:dipeptidyl aminopeptidase/acylaminoacyl peptidase